MQASRTATNEAESAAEGLEGAADNLPPWVQLDEAVFEISVYFKLNLQGGNYFADAGTLSVMAPSLKSPAFRRGDD
jgi:hypothetical protein